MRSRPLLILLLACAADPAADTAGDTAADTAADTADSDSGPACAVPTGISVVGELIPGRTVSFAVDAAGDPGEIVWTAESGGDDVGPIDAEGTWVIPVTLAVNQAEDVIVRATGCGETVELPVSLNWPEAQRVVIVYNPDVVGSEAVANVYADFRAVPDSALCPVATTADATLAGADYPAFVDAVFACVQPHTQYIVPVWGVPYKVADRIGDLAYGTPVTVSLDALLFGGPASVALSAVEYNPVYISGDSTTGIYGDYKAVGRLRQREDFWIVSRIDGASADDAIALVERTRAAEDAIAAGTLDGIVYVDGNRGDVPPATDAGFGSYEWGEWNMWGTREVFEDVGLYDVVWDGNNAEFGTDPAPLECPDALYYAGWYSYYNYNDCFTWTTGAIGAHLDSCSACDIRNSGTWSGSALLDGITATFGAVYEPYVAGMPEYDQFFYYLLQGANFGEAAVESTVVSYWMMVWVGDPLYRPYGAEPLVSP